MYLYFALFVNIFIFSQGGSGVSCEWTDFLEPESEIDHFLFGLGHVPGDSGLMDFTQVNPDQLQYIAQGMRKKFNVNVNDYSPNIPVSSVDAK